MTVELCESEESDSSWNSRLLSSTGTIYQTKNYSKFTEQNFNWNSKFLTFLDPKGNIVGQLMISVVPRFRDKGTPKKILNYMPRIKKTLYRWQYGPVIFNTAYSSEITNSLYNYLISKNCRVIGSASPLSPNPFENPALKFNSKKWCTFLIDLSQDLDIIWKNLDKNSARKNIKRSKERNVKIIPINKNNLVSYFDILQETKKDENTEFTFETIELLWKNLHPIGFEGFEAFFDDKPIGGITFSSFNNYINEWGIARSVFDFNSKLYSQDLLKWEIIEWGKKNSCNYYDLSGANPNPENKKETGILQYKKKWGGKLVEYDLLHH